MINEAENYYEIICKERFTRIDDKVDTLDGKVDALNVTVNNGLVHRVGMMNKLLWLLVGAIIVESLVSRFVG